MTKDAITDASEPLSPKFPEWTEVPCEQCEGSGRYYARILETVKVPIYPPGLSGREQLRFKPTEFREEQIERTEGKPTVCPCGNSERRALRRAMVPRWQGKHLWGLKADHLKGEARKAYLESLEQVRAYALAAPRRGYSLLLIGGVGCGKSTIAHGVMAEWILRNPGASAISTRIDKLSVRIRSLRDHDDDTEASILAEHAEAGLLLLDDFGVEHDTEASGRWAYSILEERMDYELPTIITTNLGEAQMKARSGEFGERIFSRFLECCHVVVLDSTDFRTIIADRLEKKGIQS